MRIFIAPKFILHKNNTRFYYAIDYLFPEKQIKNPRQMAGILDSVLLSRDYRLVTLPAAGPLAPLSMV
ncbi:hypothetical protein KX270_10665, partial [Escherichia coli]|nr:hypothetical protein [Escherichia coli]